MKSLIKFVAVASITLTVTAGHAQKASDAAKTAVICSAVFAVKAEDFHRAGDFARSREFVNRSDIMLGRIKREIQAGRYDPSDLNAVAREAVKSFAPGGDRRGQLDTMVNMCNREI